MKHIDAFKRDNALVDIIFQHKGKENAIGTSDIVRELQERGYTSSKESIHTLVGKIVESRKIPVCSVQGAGYYWAASKEDIQSSIEDLKAKIRGLQARCDILQSFIYE